jgi:hypothetical protein
MQTMSEELYNTFTVIISQILMYTIEILMILFSFNKGSSNLRGQTQPTHFMTRIATSS